jgi:hypothetical protein
MVLRQKYVADNLNKNSRKLLKYTNCVRLKPLNLIQYTQQDANTQV